MKRQLLTIRSQVEGARALTVFAGLHVDVMEKSADAAAAADAENLVALLTPVVKAFFTDLGMSSTLSAQQIYGGHGYIREHGMEQLVRDARIGQIYEGTNEVQALDLVARKLTGKTGEFADRFLANQKQFLIEHSDNEDVSDYVAPAAEALDRLVSATAWVRDKLDNDNAAARGAATHYLRLFALTIIACLWAQIMIAVRDKSGEFYDVKRKVARFYMQQVLPETAALADVITAGDAALGNFSVADFTV